MKKAGLNLKNIRAIDKLDMLSLLLDFPKQCEDARLIADTLSLKFDKGDFNKIVFLGIGGSAIGADLVRSYLCLELKVPILVLRGYTLPAYVDSSTLVFAVSYSGNTEETLSAFYDVGKRGAALIAISSGGALKEAALKDNLAFIQIPKGLPPRCALGFLSIIPLCVLAKMGLISNVGQHINQVIATLGELRNNSLNPNIGFKDNIAKALACQLLNRFAVIYSDSTHFDVCATRLRGQLAENSKALSSSHVLPEMNHNEIVGWSNPGRLFKNFLVILLRDKDTHPRVAKRMDITKDILKKQGVKVVEVWSRGEGLLSRIFSLIYIGDFVSYYLAILYGIDPTPVERITYLKDRLARE